MKSGFAVRSDEAAAGVVVVLSLLLEAAGKSGLVLVKCSAGELERARLLFRDTLPRKQQLGPHWLASHVKAQKDG